MTTPNKQLAKDVANELDRRRRRKRLLLLAVFAALVAAAIMLLQCGKGWGLGGGKGGGTETGKGRAPSADAGPTRCTVRVTAEGITVDGAKVTRDEAVATCKKSEGAMVTVTGDARQGDWDELRAALQAVGVPIFIRGEQPSGSGSGSSK